MSDRIPVTLLTGFLGAGKTTLLNRLLHDSTGGRIAVIVNEFGEAGLDHDLIESVAEDVVLMASGCICCSIRDDLARTLGALYVRRMRGGLTFDRVVIETTGLADPGPIHHTLLLDRLVAGAYRLDGIVTIVDAVLGTDTLERHAEAQAQVAMADRIVLSKCDLASPARIAGLDQRLDRLNPHAPRIRAGRGQVPPGALFGLTEGRDRGETGAVLAWMGVPLPESAADPLAGLSGFGQPAPAPAFQPAALSHHARDNRIATASVTIDTPIPPGVFDFWLDMIMGLRGEAILRLKAIVHLEGAAQPFVLHGVQHLLEPPVPLEDWPAGDRTSRVVLIARDLSAEDLEASLDLLRMRDGQDSSAASVTLHSLGDL
ncbi:MAG: CobW family GTP-binding protein [Paracoccus sp. (in: a-proteobacteria)]|uniref:CobW family GTP-binding protein n=1 Tax=Paracoccus sp. TaxID=267 RepID=UPI00391AC084